MKSENSDYVKIGDPRILEKVDKLFACNVGELVDLPQLVVVGDQSSGKSSVLEGLTKLPFPRDSGLCTRFATQITFRRCNEKRIKLSIIPGAKSSREHVANVESWGMEIEKLDARSFAKIMPEVYYAMNIAPLGMDDPGLPTFSEDVFRLEISGPDEAHLSVVDVPGIFSNPTGATTEEDVHMVGEMVKGYMRNPRSVILAVLAANVDVANQVILKLAKKFDPEGDRTLGILTKPDLVEKGTEIDVLDIVQGKRVGTKLGWNIVRNPDQEDVNEGRTNRESECSFFLKTPWNTLEKDKVGIESLRLRLQQVLSDHLRREFPKVRLEISKKLKANRESLESLGEGRSTSEEQGKYLLDIITKFQDIVSQAKSTNYGENAHFDKNSNLRLATLLVKREEDFALQMSSWGGEYSFSPDGGDETESCREDEEEEEQSVDVRFSDVSPDVEDILLERETVSKPASGVIAWIQKMYAESKGFHIGIFHPSLLTALMRKQARKWKALSGGYISDVIADVHRFILEALGSICPDARVRRNLVSFVIDELICRYKKSLEQTNFLLSVELGGFLRTENGNFNGELEKRRVERRRKQMEKQALDTKQGKTIRVDDVVNNDADSNTKRTVEDIRDILQSYYDISRNRFVDSVILQAAHYFLLTGPETPFELFSPAFVQTLTPGQLEDIAGEEVHVKERRNRLRREIEDLEAGRKILL